MPKELAANFKFTIPAFRKTKHGGVILSLWLPESEAAKALALGLQEDAVFEADVFVVQNETIGSKNA